jgi:Xaa-Pro aminopeptidase
VAQTLDGPRILKEELHGVDVEPMFVRCQDEGCEERARRLVKGLKTLSDVPMKGAVEAAAAIAGLHYPLTPGELDRCRRLGSRSEEILAVIAQQIRPGMRERDIEAICLWEYARRDMRCDSLLIGSDTRISRYPRPTPSEKKVERLVLLRPAVRMRGLRARVTRMVWFGDRVPKDHAARHEAACRIEAATIASCAPGRTLSSVLEVRKQLYAQTGHREEWRDHCSGGLTGYACVEATPGLGTGMDVGSHQAFNWAANVGGFAAEELSLIGPRGLEVATVRDHWPARRYEYGGCIVPMPEILKR